MRQDPARSATVGDTFTVVHRIAAPPGSAVQPRSFTDTSIVTLLGPPDVSRDGDSVRIAWSIAVWAPGRQEVIIPGPIVVRPDGNVDTASDSRIVLDVESLLPANRAAATVAPKPARPWVDLRERSWIPFALLIPAVIILAIVHWWWRRRGPVADPPAIRVAPLLSAERLDDWIAAGEARLALEHVEAYAVARGRADDAWVDAARTARYGPDDSPEIADLARRGWQHANGTP